jgi:cytochrome c oxidase subunit 4
MTPVPPESAHEPASSPSALFGTWLALMLLAALSLALRFAHLGDYGFAAALGIALVKAVLVALIFMELLYERATVRFAIVVGVALLAVMLTFMIGDVITRPIPPLDNPPGTEPRYLGKGKEKNHAPEITDVRVYTGQGRRPREAIL